MELGIVLLLLIWFAPAIIASIRGHRHGVAIFVLCLFLGWTGLGWVIALVWAFMHQPREQPRSAPPLVQVNRYEPPSPPEPPRRFPALERYNEETEADETRRGEKRR